MSKHTAFLLRFFALLMLGCWASESVAQPPPPTAADRLAWRQRMATHRKPATGCFTARFPSEEWTQTPCAAPPRMPHIRPAALTRWLSQTPAPPSPPGLAQAGNGLDFVAVAVGGPISAAEGFFDQSVDVQTVASVPLTATPPVPDGYSLQLNVAPFTTPACANAKNPQSCRGWIQYLFMNDNNGSFAFMEVWLLNFGPTCPGQGAVPQLPDMPPNTPWVNAGGDCVFDSPGDPLLAAQPITSLKQLALRGDAVNGGQDSVAIMLPDGTLSETSISDNILKLSSAWNEVEFNVLGYINGAQAQFNSGAAVVAHVSVENGTKNAPNIITTGFTGETNNFNLVPPGCRTAKPPGIYFEEITLKSQRSQACPPIIPNLECQQAKEAVAIAQAQLAKALARESEPICQGPASLECHKTVQADQQALNAAIVHRNKVCTP